MKNANATIEYEFATGYGKRQHWTMATIRGRVTEKRITTRLMTWDKGGREVSAFNPHTNSKRILNYKVDGTGFVVVMNQPMAEHT